MLRELAQAVDPGERSRRKARHAVMDVRQAERRGCGARVGEVQLVGEIVGGRIAHGERRKAPVRFDHPQHRGVVVLAVRDDLFACPGRDEKRRHAKEFLLSLPLICPFLLSWAWGEAVGALLGPGTSLERVQ